MNSEVRVRSYEEIKASIQQFNASEPNFELLEEIRTFNHKMIDEFNTIIPLAGTTILDIGASPHGYALERALELGVATYFGIGLDVSTPQCVLGKSGETGVLLRMDATSLALPEETFDYIICMSTFEHINNPALAMDEIARVLKPGGKALISFEPIWTASYGHHLHHLGEECASLIPAWAHLTLQPDEMRDQLVGLWPVNAPMGLDEAVKWIYEEKVINRWGIDRYEAMFRDSSMEVDWVMKLQSNDSLAEAEAVSVQTGISAEQLIVKGLSVLLTRNEG